jgi:hypothetical protein
MDWKWWAVTIIIILLFLFVVIAGALLRWGFWSSLF